MATATRTAPAAVRKAAALAAAARIPQQESRRRRRIRSARLSRAIICVICGLFLLGYIGLYAQVTTYGYRRAELARRIRQSEMENEALKAEIQVFSSPDRLAAAAASAGMEPGNKAEFIVRGGEVKVASAE